MMKASTRLLTAVLAVFLYSLPVPSFAQNSQSAPAAASGQGLLSGPQLEALVSPIALYPDPLLSEILMASTYPLEIVAADRWMKSNSNLQADQLKTAVAQQTWDESVRSLVATPDVLDMMSSKLDWTQKLGDAVLAQQPDVMNAVQRLRQRAESRGKLNSNPQQTVSRMPVQGGEPVQGGVPQGGAAPVQGAGEIIAIQPTDPDMLYVPYYDPAVVYGEWPYSDYPPYYWGSPGYIGAGILATGVAFGAGYALARWANNGIGWGGGLNWRNHQINPLRSVNNVNLGNNNWVHNPVHRGNVGYKNANVAQKFGGNRNAANRNPGNGNLGGGQNRGNLAGKGGQTKPGAGNRASSGNRNGAGANQKREARGNANAGNRGTNRASNNRASNNRASANKGGAKRTNTANRGSTRPSGNRTAANRGTSRGASHARNANAGRANVARSSAGARRGHGGVSGLQASARGGLGGGGMRAGGGMRGGGGRRSDLRLKHDIVEVGRLADGIGLYRFVYNGGRTTYVGVIAQEVQNVVPAAVTRGADGYFRVHYEKLGLKFQTYRRWLQSGAQEAFAAPVAR
jgi:hypothetical protein